MQLGSRCLVLFFLSFARSHFCAILFVSFSLLIQKQKGVIHTQNEIDFICGSIPPHRSCHGEYEFSFFALFVYDFPVHQRYSHHERCPSDFSCFMQIYHPAYFNISLSQMMYPVCVRFIISVSFYQNLSKMLCYRSLSVFSGFEFEKKKANEKNIRKYLLCLS